MKKVSLFITIEKVFFIFFIPLGLIASIYIGVTWDEIYESITFKANLSAIQGILQGDLSEYQALKSHHDRYYGVGFHLIENLVSSLLFSIRNNLYPFSELASYLIYSHISVFLVFCLSGCLVQRLIFRFTGDLRVAILGMMAFLLWPYMLGHGLMNIKDTPFMFLWLICTNYMLFALDASNFSLSWPVIKKIIILGLLTGLLIGIRISGVLIFLQYFIVLIFYLGQKKKTGISFFYDYKNKIKFFIASVNFLILPCFICLYLLYPLFWLDPIEFINAIRYQSHNPITIDTLTAGRFFSSQDTLYYYIPYWLSIKLPLVVIIGLLCNFFALYKMNQNKEGIKRNNLYYFLGLQLTVICIILFLLLNHVHLYNELRHLLFIFPLLFVFGVVGLYYVGQRLAISLLIISIMIFSADNIKIFPYQYTYFNEIARQLNLEDKFEKDYFAISAQKTAEWLNARDIPLGSGCIYVSPLHLWKYSLDFRKYPCVQDYPKKGFAEESSSFMVYGQVRERANFLSLPYCSIIHSEEIQLPLGSNPLVMSQLYLCRPNSERN